ncbi:MAG: RNA 2'-phosphotransferase [Spirochaetes bacterium]|nr:RNA 2'-phosphotransferase [Spirochaetota bacterium]
MTDKETISASKFMSLVLRHKPAAAGITLDSNGWAQTTALIDGMNQAGHNITLDNLKEIVLKNNKQRFKFSEDYGKIRANQGHSIAVDVEMQERQPPDILYHGTATKFLGAIKNEGIIAKNRLHVHLSPDKETAVTVGQRHGKPVVLTINAAKMHQDGIAFYLSDNGVWLTATVPVKYIYNI